MLISLILLARKKISTYLMYIGGFLMLFPPDIIRSIRQLKRINKEYVDE